ncbi:hypothetical protein HYDPIDRAFT_119914 [Hydnomerulius pinastri MD-312]|uniref:Uncharacterized protein n=1 Tax=Hydnomerulius pinastri MD-312 TaxID=994086 RepID=A0A0C9VKT4_9AGAM|nr:hypothetical protein HYDPIDRAFT_119914 [Hydnomerulius pinastri MD-312]
MPSSPTPWFAHDDLVPDFIADFSSVALPVRILRKVSRHKCNAGCCVRYSLQASRYWWSAAYALLAR